MSSDMKVIGREGNTVLEWLGDVGGLSEALICIGFVLTGSFGQARMIALLTNLGSSKTILRLRVYEGRELYL